MTEPTPVPRGSYCVRCLGATLPAELLANDHLCDACAELSWPINFEQIPEDVEGTPV
jgi:hypothetical protein